MNARPSGVSAAAHRRVEGREQRVLDEHAGPRDAVEQARLAGVGVAGDRDARHLEAVAVGALGLARGREALDLLAQPRHAGVDAAAVELDLRLTGSTASHAGAGATDLATGLAGHRLTPTTQARQQVLELRELDLRLALAALGVLAEDVEDDGGAVDDLHLDRVLERTTLARGELGVGDDGVRAERGHDIRELLHLAAAEVGARVGMRATLQQAVEHDGARGLGEGGELAQRVLGVLERAARVHADEHDVLESQLPVLDLGDVLELGRQPGDAAQRRRAPRDRTGRRRRRRAARDAVSSSWSAVARPPKTRQSGARVLAREHAVDGGIDVGVGGCGRFLIQWSVMFG